MVKDTVEKAFNMLFSQDMKDLIKIFNKNKVKYVLVGGFAVNYYGYIRTTQDIDILLYPSKYNAQKIMQSLREFGFGGAGIPQEYFETEGTAIHLGSEPNRIDLLTSLKGASNDKIFRDFLRTKFKNSMVNIISYKNLLACKKSSERKKDLADAEELEKSFIEKE